MIPKWTRQCPQRNSEPVGTEETCSACEWYDPDPRSARMCKFVNNSADTEMCFAKIREILRGDSTDEDKEQREAGAVVLVQR